MKDLTQGSIKKHIIRAFYTLYYGFPLCYIVQCGWTPFGLVKLAKNPAVLCRTIR